MSHENLENSKRSRAFLLQRTKHTTHGLREKAILDCANAHNRIDVFQVCAHENAVLIAKRQQRHRRGVWIVEHSHDIFKSLASPLQSLVYVHDVVVSVHAFHDPLVGIRVKRDVVLDDDEQPTVAVPFQNGQRLVQIDALRVVNRQTSHIVIERTRRRRRRRGVRDDVVVFQKLRRCEVRFLACQARLI